ncbi:Six-hairpin glycosidase-like protein [Fusarium avenaceum]|nr:Six-hairpin glycosidase-like protein [Fusarium avenaceum]
MTTASLLDTAWIWHPCWVDRSDNSAGAFVHFRKAVSLQQIPSEPVRLQITADTKYRLYINGHFVHIGPVKGDEHIWFYDEIDVQPFLKVGVNNIGIHVLRLYHGTPYGTSFPRMAFPGLFVRMADGTASGGIDLESNGSWSCSLDQSHNLRIDLKEDDFLHIYEDVINNTNHHLEWVTAQCLNLPKSHGLGPPWKLAPRMIPFPKVTRAAIKDIHNVRSTLVPGAWKRLLVGLSGSLDSATDLVLPAGTSHHVELEADHHMTAHLKFRFRRPQAAGARLSITYAECYEDTPKVVPYLRCKGDRCDRTKQLLGPEDRYVFAGEAGAESAKTLQYTETPGSEEMFSPFHFRTFRFLALDIHVGHDGDLVMTGLDVETTHYPLEVVAEIDTPDPFYAKLWSTSIRTLTNCMHDCYEDCPFYEQLQYAMDVRSSCLFTYSVSGDDRMARQAIVQLHSSYRADLGLIASRSPASQLQIIPHFSLFWILTVVDHFEYFGDSSFTRRFVPVADGILEAFARRIDPELGLISAETPFWDFVDWTDEWRPMGIPPAAEASGYQTFTNMLYAHAMQRLVLVLVSIGRTSLADEFRSRASAIVASVRQHCRVGDIFTDGLASAADSSRDLSQHNQVWAVLCGAVSGDKARHLLSSCLPMPNRHNTEQDSVAKSDDFTKPSQAMSFYLFRSLSEAGGSLYDDAFESMWQPWRDQLSQNLTTWCEDNVTRRSDCHAWSCAPLYELMAEVAGVRPAEPGYRSIAFKPRTRLFPHFDGRVPLSGMLASVTAHVRWRRLGGDSAVIVSLTLESSLDTKGVYIHVTYPDGHTEVHFGLSLELRF